MLIGLKNNLKSSICIHLFPNNHQFYKTNKNPENRINTTVFGVLILAGVQGLEPWARGFGDRNIMSHISHSHAIFYAFLM